MSRWKNRLAKSFNPNIAAVLTESERFRTIIESPSSRSARILASLAIRATKDAYLRRTPVIWASLLVPSEIIMATGAIPFYPELIGPNLARIGLENVCLLEAERLGVPPSACASQRVSMGAVSLELLARPDALVCTTELCDANVRAFRQASRRFSKPLFVIDIPADRDADALGYLAIELGDLVAFMSDELRLSVGHEQLARAIVESNRARSAFDRLNELRKVVALPRRETVDLYSTIPHFGRPELADFFNRLSDEISGRPAVAGSPRLLWLNVKPYAAKGILNRIEKRGASIVFEESNQVYWPELDPARPITGLASKILAHYAHGPLNTRIERILSLSREYQVDGVVSLAHPGCRFGMSALPHILARLSNAGIRTFAVDEDPSSNATMDGGLATLDDFLEALKGAA